MFVLKGRYAPLVLIASALLLASLMPAFGHTKLYQFENTTGGSQSGVRVVTWGLEGVMSSYSDQAWGMTPGYTVLSGVWCSTLSYGTDGVSAGTDATVAWSTYDNSCLVTDLRWASGYGIMPTGSGGVPGSTVTLYDEQTGNLVCIIINETGQPMPLTNTDFGLFDAANSLENLEVIAETGFLERRVAEIQADIAQLRLEVRQAEADGILNAPSANSLCRKLDKAEEYLLAGLAEWQAGDAKKAYFNWDKAAHQMDNFVSEVKEESDDKGHLAGHQDIADDWMARGSDIAAAIRELPGTQPIQEAFEAPATMPQLPTYPDLSGLQPYPWPAYELPPNTYTAFEVPGMPQDSAFTWRGRVYDDQGNLVLTWLEEAIAEDPVPDTEPPVIESATISPEYLWSPDHEMVDMTVTATVSDNRGAAVWWVDSVTSNQAVDGTGDGDTAPDWEIDPDNPQLLKLRRERSGNNEVRTYTVTLTAVDAAGNYATPRTLTVDVDHDQSTEDNTVQISSLVAVPANEQSVQVAFTLAADSTVDAQVLNIAGRPIKALATGRDCEGGVNTLVWNCKSDRGLAVPSGRYLIRMTARSDDGQQCSRTCSVLVER